MSDATSHRVEHARLRAALDVAGDAVVVTDLKGVILEANGAATRLNGTTREAVVGRTMLEVGREVGAGPAELAAVGAALAGTIDTYESHRRTRAGDVVSAAVTVTRLPGTDTVVFMTPGIDAHRERRSYAARSRTLAEAGRLLAIPQDLDATLATMAGIVVPECADGVFIALIDPAGALRLGTLRATEPGLADAALAFMPAELAGAPAGGLLEDAVRDRRPLLVSDADAKRLDQPIRDRLAGLGVSSMVLLPLAAHGELVGVLCAVTARASDRRLDENDLELFAALGERTALGIHAARLHEAMRAAEGRFRAAFDHAPIGIALTRVDAGQIRYAEVNPALCVIAGYPREQLVGRPVFEFTHPEDRPGEERRLRWLVEGQVEEVSGEKRLVRADGEVRWVQVRAAPLRDGSYVVQVQDVTERRRFQHQLEHLASHDTLTGVLNRRRFEEALEQALAHVRRHGDSAAVLTLDMDNFKHINDTYGHAAGDDVLRAAADSLQSRLRATDQIGRLGGDEFGVILWRTDADAARTVARELLDALRDVRVTVGERQVRVTASAGLRSLEPAETFRADDLLSEADMAMYDAKERGRDRLSVLRAGDLQPERVRARIRWSERIRDALDTDAFALYEQPIVRLSDGVVDRSELLIRMVGSDGELILPGDFLPVAERYGQIQAIDRWVVCRAIELLMQRADAGTVSPVEVNLSGESVSDPGVVDFIVEEVRRSAIDPAQLIFEVTETSAIGNLEQARELAERLTGLGCGFALDDFGAGFGSFAYLKHLPLSIIKIDGQFVRGLRTSHADQVTVRAIVDVARGLGKETVAECVEEEETLEVLRELGVDRAQGYQIGPPGPVQVVPEFSL